MQEIRHTIGLGVVAAMSVIAVGGTLYQSSKMETLHRQIAAYQQDNNALREKLVQSGADLQTALNSLHQELADAKEEANSSLTMAQKAAIQRADVLARKQREQAVRLNAELDKVKQTTTEGQKAIAHRFFRRDWLCGATVRSYPARARTSRSRTA